MSTLLPQMSKLLPQCQISIHSKLKCSHKCQNALANVKMLSQMSKRSHKYQNAISISPKCTIISNILMQRELWAALMQPCSPYTRHGDPENGSCTLLSWTDETRDCGELRLYMQLPEHKSKSRRRKVRVWESASLAHRCRLSVTGEQGFRLPVKSSPPDTRPTQLI